jgi:transcriptional regulator with XRE-family HTH domain
MAHIELLALGKRIAELRIARQLKQTELAYEAGVSHRTLQRLEAGEPVKSDGLMKVIKCLGRQESVMAALDSSGFSPYERLAETGLKVSDLKKQRAAPSSSERGLAGGGAVKSSGVKRRVRRARGEHGSPGGRGNKVVTVQWPEDQK